MACRDRYGVRRLLFKGSVTRRCLPTDSHTNTATAATFRLNRICSCEASLRSLKLLRCTRTVAAPWGNCSTARAGTDVEVRPDDGWVANCFAKRGLIRVYP